jgi:hypothetical protein
MMPVVTLPLVQVRQFQTQTLFALREVGPGTYHVPLQIEGNSILSSLLVTDVSLDASIQVNYFQTTTGDEEEERSPLVSHTAKTSGSMAADTIIVARVHLKPVCEVIITGGTVTFGLMVTMVSAFASDIESSLFKDNFLVGGTERGIPIMTLDEVNGTLNFVRSRGGNLIVDQKPGDPIHIRHSGDLNKDNDVVVCSYQNLDKSFKISQFTAVSASDYRFYVLVDNELVVSSRTSQYQPQSDQHLDPYRIVPATSVLTVKAHRLTNVNDGTFDVYLRGYEFINPEDSEMASLIKVAFNNSGTLILPFKAVAWKDDNSIALADADGIGLDDFAGVTQAGIANLGYGVVYKVGEVPGALIGKGAIAGQAVYLSAIPGELTLTPPLTGTVLRIGRAEPPSGGATGEATSLFIDPQIISE